MNLEEIFANASKKSSPTHVVRLETSSSDEATKAAKAAESRQSWPREEENQQLSATEAKGQWQVLTGFSPEKDQDKQQQQQLEQEQQPQKQQQQDKILDLLTEQDNSDPEKTKNLLQTCVSFFISRKYFFLPPHHDFPHDRTLFFRNLF